MFEKILRNVQEYSGECSQKISGNVIKDSGESSRTFREMFQKIPGNINFDLFLEILLVFYQILLLNYYKTMEKSKENIFFTTTYN